MLPPRGHQVYHWPDDLIRPNLVLLLIVSETERETRLSKRVVTEKIAKTREEEMLTKSKLFQRRLKKIDSWMGPQVTLPNMYNF